MVQCVFFIFVSWFSRFYAPISIDQEHLGFALCVCFSLCLRKTLKFAITFEW